MLKAVIFDFDGVIADSESLHYNTFNDALAAYNVKIDKDDYYESYLGYSDSDCIDTISEDFKLNLSPEQKSALEDTKQKLFDELVASETCIFDGVSEFISMLKSNGIRIAICSGALRAEIKMMLANSDFADAFELMVGADDVTNSKPDPECYLLTLSRLNEISNLKADECVVIEDSRWGLRSAPEAGMNTVAVTTSYPAEKITKYAKKVVPSLSELTLGELNELCD